MRKLNNKKTITLIISFLIIVASVIGGITYTTATNKKANIMFAEASVSNSGVVSELNSSYKHEKVLYGYINGSVGYCLNYAKSANNGQVMTRSDEPQTNLSEKKKQQLALCLKFGYSSSSNATPSNAQKNKYIATQAMVWSIVEGLFNTGKDDSAARKLCDTAPDADTSYSFYKEIKSNMNASLNNKKPSFANETKDKAKTYSLTWNEKNGRYETVITDKNKSLSNYDISLPEGYRYEINNNSVKIYTKKVLSSGSGKLISKSSVVSVTTSQVYWKPSDTKHQEFMCGPINASPIKYFFKLETQENGSIKVIKKDADSGKVLKGAKYGLYKNQKCTDIIKSKETAKNGEASFDELSDGTYYVKEIKAPIGYNISDEVFTTTISKNKNAITLEAFDKKQTISSSQQYTSISITKTGEKLTKWENDQFVYETSILPNAEYLIAAAEDIVEEGRVVHPKDEIVDTIKTDENGKATSNKLHYGKYYLKEINAPTGYVIDKETHEAELKNKEPVNLTLTNKRQKLYIKIKKKDAVDNSPVKGAEFALYAAEDIKNANNSVIVTKGTLLEKAVSDENGKVTFTKDYPLGTYIAREIEIPAGYIYTKEEVTFEATYADQDVNAIELEKEVTNVPTVVEITKEDLTTGTELTGAKLSVIDENGQIVDSWISDAAPHKVKGLTVNKTYTLHEELAPTGYLLAEDVIFTVQDTSEVQRVVMKDTTPTGEINISKKGEFLTSVKEVKEPYVHQEFQYRVATLGGITFDVIAADDIVSADGQNVVSYPKGTVVGTLKTDENGKAILENLPLGSYIVKEKETLPGYVLDTTEYPVNLTYKDQNERVVSKTVEITNKLQKAEVLINKTNADTAKPVSGAAFTLTNKSDIINYQGKVILPANTVIATAVSDNDGKVKFEQLLPLGTYIVTETKAPKGYVNPSVSYEINADYQKEKGEVLKIENTIKNSQTKLDICKTDITGENEIEGATLTLYDEKGNLIERWVSEKTPHRLTGLPIGKYVLKEETAPYGYIITNDVIFEIKNSEEIQKCVMKDDTAKGQIIIYKTDDTGLNYLKGAKFEIKDNNGKTVEKITSNKDGIAKSSLLQAATFSNGKYVSDIVYTVQEVEAPKGYEIDDTSYKVSFAYKDDKTPVIVQEQTITNQKLEEDIPNGPVFFSNIPGTGDTTNIGVWIAIAGVSLLGMITIVIISKKKKKQEIDDTHTLF